jgi:hypothetical protein
MKYMRRVLPRGSPPGSSASEHARFGLPEGFLGPARPDAAPEVEVAMATQGLLIRDESEQDVHAISEVTVAGG